MGAEGVWVGGRRAMPYVARGGGGGAAAVRPGALLGLCRRQHWLAALCLASQSVVLPPTHPPPSPQFTKLNRVFREEKRQREGGEPAGGHGHGGGGH